MKPYALGQLHDSQNRVRHEFLDFAEQWQTTRSQWKDEPAQRFEQQYLTSLAPTLTRAAAAMQAFADAIRQADRALQDPDTQHID